MCGIAGAIDRAADRAAVHVGVLNEAQSHRGPDHSVVLRVGAFTLGNTRLAIQDPGPAGNQPFVSADGRYYCVFNGEIYNHRRLIERYGLRTRTSCDGEVIPELWAKLGTASLAELRGMFAIALVDSLEERLYLARDPFGIKPLYWRTVPQGLLFASEVRPLVRVAGSARVDPREIARFLHLGAVAADRSPFLEVTSVPPNGVASFDASSRASVHPILSSGPLAMRAGDAGLGAALTDSVELHLGADVPTALLLSGGVDSAAIAAASRHLDRDLDCLTVAADGAADESEQAAKTAVHYNHRFRRVPAALESADLARFFGAMQRPTIDGLNTYIISKAVHEAGFKVALSGLGGDETVGGYSHFRLLKYLPALRALDKLPARLNGVAASGLSRMGSAGPAKLRRLFAAGGPREGWGLSELQREVLPGSLVTALTGIACRQIAPPGLPGAGSFSEMVAAEVAIYLQAMLLPDADGFSMASSVELRVPFVDRHVFAASLGRAVGKTTRPGKAAIGMALGDPYLRWLAAQPKRGFSVPMRRWMTGPLAPVLRAADEPQAAVWSFADRRMAERAGLLPLRPRERWSEAWAFAVLNTWLETSYR
jgi:asparagine synthase (glutamine-hydrolysing)